MAEKLLMLALSPTMEEGVIVNWQKNEGDQIETGDVLCEVETDKAVMEYESQSDGVLLKIAQDEGNRVPVGATIAVMGDEGEDISGILEEIKSEGESQAPEAPAPEPAETTPEPPAEDKPEPSLPAEALPKKHEEPTPSTSGKIRISPLARKLADKHNLDTSSIHGSGPYGRIVEKDVKEAMSRPPTMSTPPAMAAATTMEDKTVPVSEKRRVIAKRLSDSKYTAPHYYLKLTAAMDGLIEARKILNAKISGKVSFNAFLIKLAAEALRRHPMVNATWNGDTIRQHGRVDVALAVAQQDGLITPVVRNCQNKGILTIEDELKNLIERARRNALQPPDYSNSTFTITNLGMFDIEEFTAIINQPNSAILALGKMMKQPVFNDNDEIFVQTVMKLTLSCDHRLVDGAVGAAFLRDLKDMIENPVCALY